MAQLKDSLITGDLRVTGTIYGDVPLNDLVDADDLKAIEALSGTSGLLKKTAANTWTLDTNAYTTSSGVTSVRVQATSPVVSSVNTAQTSTLNTTISLVDGYGDTKNPYASKTARYVLAAPASAAGAPSFRALTNADVGLGNVENTKLSTWAGSGNITTIGTLTSGTVPWARLSGVPSTMTPSSHTHGNITNDGKIGTAANQAAYTTTNGVVTAGTLPAAAGGTGKTTLKDAANALINALETGSSNLTANDYVITQYVGGGSTTTTYHRRPASALRVGGLLTARTFTIGSTGKTFDGTGNVSWTLAEIGAAAANHNHDSTYVNVSGDTMTGALTLSGDPTSAKHAATKQYVDQSFAANDAMIFKGTIGSSGATVTVLPNTHSIGWTYRVLTTGTYAGVKCEVGDLIICIADGTSANNAHWTVAQTNIDGAVVGPASATNGHIALFDGTTGKIIKNSSYSPSNFAAAGHTHSSIVTVGDQRNNDTTPNSYNNNFIFQGLKTNSKIGFPTSDNYSYVIGLRGWSDSSGGNSHELAFNNTGIFWRSGATTTWGNWYRIYTTSNKPSIANHSVTTPTGETSRTANVELNTTTVNSITAVGTLPSLTVTATDVVTGGTTTAIPNISKKTVVTGVTKKTVVTGGSTTAVPNISKKTVVTSATAAKATYSSGILTISDGSVTTGDSVTVGTAINAYTSLTTGDSVTVTTGDSVTVGTAINAYTALTTSSIGSASDWSPGALPTKGSNTTVATSVKTQPTFTVTTTTTTLSHTVS